MLVRQNATKQNRRNVSYVCYIFVSFKAYQVFIAQLSKLSELLRQKQVRFAYCRPHLALYCNSKSKT